MNSLKFFISYSHKDEEFKDELLTHLSGLKNKGVIEDWHDGKIIPGQEWDQEIKRNLRNSDVVLFLVSHYFMNSDYINNTELSIAFNKYENKELLVVPIVIKHCDLESIDLSKFHALPKGAKPLESWDPINEGFLNVVNGIKKLIEKFPFEKRSATSLKEKTENNNFACDTPPKVEHFVGRKKELELIDNNLFKVVYITGFGGTGKSTLASYYLLQTKKSSDNWEFWDWRDCREEGNRIKTKVIEIIERLSNGDIKPNSLLEASSEDLVRILFRELEDRKILFIFDNIDAYIDLEDFLPIGILKQIHEEAIKRDHNSKFIFTCRPFIKYADADSYQINLGSLEFDETKELIEKFDLPFEGSKKENIIDEIHDLTEGHPLWISLLAAQANSGLETIRELLDNIKKDRNSNELDIDVSDILSNRILNNVFKSLNHKQLTLLRGLAEAVKPEKIEEVKEMLGEELNYNQATRSLRALKFLNLIVIKSNKDSELIELHPLVKQYIRNKYPQRERSTYISLLTSYYDKLILTLKESLSDDLSLKKYENWTSKVELNINNKDFESALNTLEEVCRPMIKAGFKEEYIRTASLLFEAVDFEEAIKEKLHFFKSQFQIFIESLIQYGEFKKADTYLDKFNLSIKNKGQEYLLLCNLRSYYHWYSESYENAIQWGETAKYLVEKSNIDDKFNTKHNLALSLRDSRNKENVKKALSIFLKGESIEELLNQEKINKDLGSDFYGNVGRCLWYLGKNKQALEFYKISYQIIKKENTIMTDSNKGYPSYWIGELLREEKEYKLAYLFYKNSLNIWKQSSPPRAHQIADEIQIIEKRISEIDALKSQDEIMIESKCDEWVQNGLKDVLK